MVSYNTKQHDGIFGTPPEPIFNVNLSAMSSELLGDWLHVLAVENKEQMKQSSYNSDFEFPVEYIFQACQKFGLSPGAKYLSLEIFNKFIVAHIRDLYNRISGANKTGQVKEWLTVLERVKKQIPLRVISCCQLASKLTSNYKVVRPNQAQRTLSYLGHNYSLDSILQSEIRILKTLDYKVQLPSPLLYIETLLEILGYNEGDKDIKAYHGVCLMLLDIVYLQGLNIYNSLHHLATGRLPSSSSDKSRFAAVKNDYILEAVAIIAASSYITNQKKTEKVVESLNQITNVSIDDILDFATIIIQQI